MHVKFLSLALFANLIAATSAHAHATFETPQAKVDSYYKAVLKVPHGCDGQPTLNLRVTVPEGLIAVKPMPKAGWTLETSTGNYAQNYSLHGKKVMSGVKQITWTGSLESDHYDEFVFQARVTNALMPGKPVHVPVVQKCADGSVAWTEIPAAGQDPHDLKRPAPGIMILAASSDHETGHASMKQPSYNIGDLVITNVRAGATVPKAPVAGGYMLIKNNGSEADFLVGGKAAFSGDVQIHEMKMQGDVMKMRELADGLEIPAGGEVMLKPGGYHVMFMKLTEPLSEGESRKATLTFKKAGSVEVEFDIKNRKHLKSHGMDHSKHGNSN
ncbi:DUF1775 domain-containing protein [Anderseniella sp. Alg231-50]|uniref:DUF1775 domain-containing protein n=1 Tax=Anderseniella sp. Alg231-50 TaxID=1922226 RepID=UPI000D559B7C